MTSKIKDQVYKNGKLDSSQKTSLKSGHSGPPEWQATKLESDDCGAK